MGRPPGSTLLQEGARLPACRQAGYSAGSRRQNMAQRPEGRRLRGCCFWIRHYCLHQSTFQCRGGPDGSADGPLSDSPRRVHARRPATQAPAIAYPRPRVFFIHGPRSVGRILRACPKFASHLASPKARRSCQPRYTARLPVLRCSTDLAFGVRRTLNARQHNGIIPNSEGGGENDTRAHD